MCDAGRLEDDLDYSSEEEDDEWDDVEPSTSQQQQQQQEGFSLQVPGNIVVKTDPGMLKINPAPSLLGRFPVVRLH